MISAMDWALIGIVAVIVGAAWLADALWPAGRHRAPFRRPPGRHTVPEVEAWHYGGAVKASEEVAVVLRDAFTKGFGDDRAELVNDVMTEVERRRAETVGPVTFYKQPPKGAK